MAQHRSGCLICGKPLEYYEAPVALKCAVCGKSFQAEAACQDKHYVCDTCHAKAGLDAITEVALHTPGKDPLAIAAEMMRQPFVNMHGPEHHYLPAAALLAAYHNAGGKVDLPQKLKLARQRAAKVPGGICGLWGSCGSAVAVGIFASLVMDASPLTEESFGLANLATARCLESIGRTGGPRCCKRNSWLAITEAVRFCREHLGIAMEENTQLACAFFPMNAECKKAGCPYYPQKAGRI